MNTFESQDKIMRGIFLQVAHCCFAFLLPLKSGRFLREWNSDYINTCPICGKVNAQQFSKCLYVTHSSVKRFLIINLIIMLKKSHLEASLKRQCYDSSDEWSPCSVTLSSWVISLYTILSINNLYPRCQPCYCIWPGTAQTYPSTQEHYPVHSMLSPHCSILLQG